MIKIIKKIGNSLIIRFNKEDTSILDLKEGDIVRLEINKVKSGEND